MLSHCMRISVTECYFHANYTWLVLLVDFRVLVYEPSNSLTLEPYSCRELAGSKGTWRREAACSVPMVCPGRQRWSFLPRGIWRVMGSTGSWAQEMPKENGLPKAYDSGPYHLWPFEDPGSWSIIPSPVTGALLSVSITIPVIVPFDLKMTYQAIVFMNFPSSILPVTLIIKYFLVHGS